MWDYIADCMETGCHDITAMVDSLYKSLAQAGMGMSEAASYDKVTFEKCFFLCWSRYMYQQEYVPKRIFPEKKQINVKKKRVPVWMAVAQGKKPGVFSQSDGAKQVAGYPHAKSMTFYSKWAAEKWLELQKKEEIEEKLQANAVECAPEEAVEKPAGEEAKVEAADGIVQATEIQIINSPQDVKQVLVEDHGGLPVPAELNPVEEIVASDTGESEEGGDDLQANTKAVKKAVGKAAIHEEKVRTKLSLIRGIQFDKHIFRNTSREYQDRFRKTIAHKLQKLEHIIRGNVGRAGNDFKLVAVGKGHRRRVYKHRVGSQRLSMVLKEGVITLLRLSSHDRQMVDIRNIRGGNVGYIYYDMRDFLQQVDNWQKDTENLGAYLSTPQHYVYDTAQQDIILAGDSFVNMSIVGNAGAGKSVVGLKWIEDTLSEGQGNCLYLTMSENLVYTLGYEFRKSLEASHSHSRADIITTFDFIRSSFKAYYPQIPERCLLNASQSLEVFREFWQQQVDWKWFWNTRDERLGGQTEETTLLTVWREIHGILKGAVQDFVLGQPYRQPGILSEAEYKKRLRQEKKNIDRDVLWVNTLYKVCNMYQKYLRRQGLYDDNDMAAMLLAKGAKYGQQYEAVFLDECQDLTQIELLAIFTLLEGTPHKRMASDRCQMVQPTYFSEGWMRTTVNEYDRAMGREIDEAGQKPYYLHYNYRSTRSIIDFQNFIVDYFYTGDIMTLKLSEMQEIQAPPLAVAGMRPIWICPSEENQRLLIENLWQKVDAASLQVILPFGNSGDRESFQLVADKPIMDIIECKGMEYPNVLMFNVLSEVQFDTALAWKYFYVGATRSNSCLLIYEKDAVPGTDIYRFLQDAADLGLVDKCESLLADTHYMDSSWLGYAYQCITENMDDSRLETAENALNFGQYELALDIFRRESQDANMINYCQGKVYEKHKAYHEALQSYGQLEPGWFSQGRTRKNSAEDMLKKPDLSGREFLGAYILSQAGEENLLLRAMDAWQYKYGSMRQFYEAFYEALRYYGFGAEAFGRWTEKMLAVNSSLEKRCRETARNSLVDTMAKESDTLIEDKGEEEANGI